MSIKEFIKLFIPPILLKWFRFFRQHRQVHQKLVDHSSVIEFEFLPNGWVVPENAIGIGWNDLSIIKTQMENWPQFNENLRPCPPTPDSWPEAVENTQCPDLWQREFGSRPETSPGLVRKALRILKYWLEVYLERFKRFITGRFMESTPNSFDVTQSVSEVLKLVREQNIATRLLLGKQLANQVKQHGVFENIHDVEFKVFSQFGDDGILQYLIYQTHPRHHTFIEFGVQDYSEANTRFLLENDNWRGLIIDGNAQAMLALHLDEIYWRFDLTAVGAFITCDNINQLIRDNGFSGEIGLLSVDIDGNDYWVWEAINSVEPLLVVAEYNSVFGAEFAITIPYDPEFVRTKAHHSNLYWGCSLKALCLLAEKKGYVFVGSNSNGCNAHFVRKDKLGKIPPVSIETGYVESKYRESRDLNGNLTYLSGKERLQVIKDLEVFNVETGSVVNIGSLFGL